jgi:serine/threonine-protein kinase
VLPAHIEVAARQRLFVLSVVFTLCAATTALIAVAGVLPPETTLAMASVAVVSVSVALTTWNTNVSNAVALRSGLGATVLYCFVFSFLIARQRYENFGLPGDATWTCIILVVVPLLIPAPPREIAPTLALGALTAPVGVWWIAQTTDFEVSPVRLIGFALSPAFAAVLGYVGARSIYRLGLDVGRAEQMGNYRLLAKLGAGGMGEVWRAEHALFARPAAVKFIHAAALQNDAEELQIRLMREASAMASLRSPHTVEVFDFGIANDGRFFFAMELLEGQDLQHFVEDHGALPPHRAVFLLRQILESIEEAHVRGLLHRDLKPANIFVCRYGLKSDFIKVLDFGLVRDTAIDVERVTRSSDTTAGTPAYMPPEASMHGVFDEQGDVYAIGCVLFWMLTGRTVFTGPTALAQSFAHVSEEPPVPSTVNPGAGITHALDQLVLDALAKDPADRVTGAAAFRERLNQLPLGPRWSSELATAWWEDDRDIVVSAAPRRSTTDPTLMTLE